MDGDHADVLAGRVAEAFRSGEPLAVRGAGTRAADGPGAPLVVAGHAGVVDYAPTELVVTARAGTPLDELDAVLAAEGQMLGCEPPRRGPSTVGGALACGLSGPGRPWYGALRDFVLGTRIINGRGEILRFGGQVIKNVAGYDVPRLMAGARGTLGVILEVSFKVLPQPQAEATRALELDARTALARLAAWGRRPLPITAAAWSEGVLYLRLSGPASAIGAAAAELGGEPVADDKRFWHALRDRRLPFFDTERPLWRWSVPPAAPFEPSPGEQWLLDWGGAQRWLASDADPAEIRHRAAALGGHAAPWGGDDGLFDALPPPLAALQRRLKQAFDPSGILNPGRL